MLTTSSRASLPRSKLFCLLHAHVHAIAAVDRLCHTGLHRGLTSCTLVGYPSLIS